MESVHVSVTLHCLWLQARHQRAGYNHPEDSMKTLTGQALKGRRGDSSPVKVGAASNWVVAEIFLGFLIAEVFQRIRPQQVTHGPKSRWLLEPIQLKIRERKKKPCDCWKLFTRTYSNLVQHVITFLISSKVCISGESPPWTHRNCWFMSAARGRQSNASIHESYTCSEYLILPDRRQKWNQLW